MCAAGHFCVQISSRLKNDKQKCKCICSRSHRKNVKVCSIMQCVISLYPSGPAGCCVTGWSMPGYHRNATCKEASKQKAVKLTKHLSMSQPNYFHLQRLKGRYLKISFTQKRYKTLRKHLEERQCISSRV